MENNNFSQFKYNCWSHLFMRAPQELLAPVLKLGCLNRPPAHPTPPPPASSRTSPFSVCDHCPLRLPQCCSAKSPAWSSWSPPHRSWRLLFAPPRALTAPPSLYTRKLAGGAGTRAARWHLGKCFCPVPS